MVRPRILVIGAGMVGSTSAASIAARDLGTVSLYDIEKDLAVGRAMDINHCLPSRGSDSLVAGYNDLGEAGPADIVVIAAGMARTAGMTRLDLLRNNARVIESLAPVIAAQCPGARALVVPTPWTSHLAHGTSARALGYGLGCSLDTIRLRHLIARAACGLRPA
jgi:malate dehydrogenase